MPSTGTSTLGVHLDVGDWTLLLLTRPSVLSTSDYADTPNIDIYKIAGCPATYFAHELAPAPEYHPPARVAGDTVARVTGGDARCRC